jgi:Berberine and berberine like
MPRPESGSRTQTTQPGSGYAYRRRCGLRRDHVLIEILATFAGRSDELEEERHRLWTRATLHAFDAIALPGGYPNFLPNGDTDRATESYGSNSERLIRAKRQYDPDNIFSSAIPLPVSEDKRHAAMSA